MVMVGEEAMLISFEDLSRDPAVRQRPLQSLEWLFRMPLRKKW